MSQVSGKINIGITATTAGLKAGVSSALGILDGFGGAVARIGKTGAAALGVMAGTGLGLFSADVAQAFGELDQRNDAVNKLHVDPEALTSLGYAAKLSGVEADTLNAALGKLQVNLGKATSGSGPAAAALSSLGLSAKDLAAMPTEQALGMIADAISALPTPAAQAQAAVALFGKSGQALLPLLNEGSAGIAAFTREAESLGVVLTDQDLTQIAAANDAIDRVKAAWGGVANEIAVQLSPLIEEVSASILGLEMDFLGFGDTATDSLGVVGEAFAAVVDWFNSVGNTISLWIASALEGLGALTGSTDLAELGKAMRETAEAVSAGPSFSERARERMRANRAAAEERRRERETAVASAVAAADSIPDSITNELKKEAEAVIEATRTPVEKFFAEQEKLAKLFSTGLIDETTYQRALDAAKSDLDEAKEKDAKKGEIKGTAQNAAALEAGSSAAYSAFLANQRGQRDKTEENTGNTVRQLERTNRLLEETAVQVAVL